ncbi:MAG: M1 family aminopeptidase [Thermaurantimonas sp.]
MMLRILYVCVVWSSLWAVCGQSTGSLSDEDGMACKRPMMLKSRLLKSGQLSSPLMTKYDVLYHRLHFWINPDNLYIVGEAATHFATLSDSVTTVVFDLRNTMSVDSVKSLRTGQPLSFQHQFHQISIQLSQILQKGVLDSIVIYYRGTPVSTGLGSVGRLSYSFGSALWTLSQPYGSSDWWPSKDGLTDKIDSIDILITTPVPNRGASLGILASESVANGQRTSHWKHRYPVAPYLVAIAVAPYVVFDQPITLPSTGQSLPFINYVYPTDTPQVYQSVQYTHGVMQMFDTLFVSYPFKTEKYGHARFGWSGGMEHQTMSFMGGWQQDLITHELAHMWFGDLVTCGSWADLWLNEGWAVYLTQLTYEYLKPQLYQAYKTNEINKITAQPGGSVYTLDTLNLSRLFSSRLTYSKAGYVLHMLRWLIGDSAFFAGTRNYLKDSTLAYSFALTPQFVNHMEAACKCSLTDFFDQWLYGEGYPSYQIIWWQDADTLRLNVSQTTSHPSVPWFSIPIPVRVTDSNQQVHDLRIPVQSASFSHAHYLPAGAAVVAFDPDLWLVSKNSVSLHISQFRDFTPRLSLFPNPGGDVLFLSMGSRAPDVQNIIITTHDGRILKTYTPDQSVISGGTIQLPVRSLPEGTYIITIQTSRDIYHLRWVKAD